MLRSTLLTLTLALSFTTLACGRAPESIAAAPESRAPSADLTTARSPSATPPKAPLSQKTFGASIGEKITTPLSSIVEDASKFIDRTVRTEGTVTAVCKSMGCWMEIGDDSGQVHVKMAGHSFFVPKTSSGRRAIVEGKVIAPDGVTCGDSCRSHAAPGTGKMAAIELMATGVEFID
jgi:hypothetical protein